MGRARGEEKLPLPSPLACLPHAPTSSKRLLQGCYKLWELYWRLWNARNRMTVNFSEQLKALLVKETMYEK